MSVSQKRSFFRDASILFKSIFAKMMDHARRPWRRECEKHWKQFDWDTFFLRRYLASFLRFQFVYAQLSSIKASRVRARSRNSKWRSTTCKHRFENFKLSARLITPTIWIHLIRLVGVWLTVWSKIEKVLLSSRFLSSRRIFQDREFSLTLEILSSRKMRAARVARFFRRAPHRSPSSSTCFFRC